MTRMLDILLPILYRLPALVIAVTLHEYVKAAASWRLGDNVPKLNRRITLNPLKHIDPIGAICIALFGFGWGKPVETSPMYYSNRKQATITVYALPSLANLVVGLVFGFAAYIVGEMPMAETAQGIVHGIIFQIAFVNIAMAFFNIIPIYPLDGARIFALFLSPQARVKMASYEKWFQLFLICFIVMGFAGMVFGPLVDGILEFAMIYAG